MRKQALFVAIGSLLALASCNSATNDTHSDAMIDSMVDARVEEIRMDLMRQNDSIIHAMAVERADSILNASQTTSTTTRRKSSSSSSSSSSTTTVPAEDNTPTNTGKRGDQSKEGENTGKRGNQSEEGVNTGKRR